MIVEVHVHNFFIILYTCFWRTWLILPIFSHAPCPMPLSPNTSNAQVIGPKLVCTCSSFFVHSVCHVRNRLPRVQQKKNGRRSWWRKQSSHWHRWQQQQQQQQAHDWPAAEWQPDFPKLEATYPPTHPSNNCQLYLNWIFGTHSTLFGLQSGRAQIDGIWSQLGGITFENALRLAEPMNRQKIRQKIGTGKYSNTYHYVPICILIANWMNADWQGQRPTKSAEEQCLPFPLKICASSSSSHSTPTYYHFLPAICVSRRRKSPPAWTLAPVQWTKWHIHQPAKLEEKTKRIIGISHR
jgi:hypothetical protein